MTNSKENLIEAYVERIVDAMDTKCLVLLTTEYLEKIYSEYDLEELKTEIEENYPDILEEV